LFENQSMIIALHAAYDWLRFSVAASGEFYRAGLICLPPSWLISRRQDPYAFYAKLRDRSSVHRSSLADGVILSRAADVAWAMSESRLTSDVAHSRQWQRARQLHGGDPAEARPLVLAEGNDHRRCRKAIATLLESQWQESFATQAARRIEERLEALPPRGSLEAMDGLVLPLMRKLTLDLLGILPEDRPSVERLLRPGLTFAFHHGESLLRFPGVMSRDQRGARAYRGRVRNVFRNASQRAYPETSPGVLPALLRLVRRAILTLEEALVLAEEIMAACFEPVSYVIGNSLMALAERPELFDRLRGAPNLIPVAVKELERFDAAVQAVFRYASEDVALRGETIRAGEQVVLLLGSANRDPRCYYQPDEINIDRAERTQFTFGKGTHTCVGARIARTLHEIVLNEFVTRYSSMRLGAKPAWQSNLPMRGLLTLPLVLRS
jgi:cytochrome P450